MDRQLMSMWMQMGINSMWQQKMWRKIVPNQEIWEEQGELMEKL